jgi:mannose-6-phosphate isomerase
MLGRVTAAIDPRALTTPLRPIPHRSRRPWAGTRLGGRDEHVGELWLAGPGLVVEVPGVGRRTLDELAAEAGAALVGERGMALLGARFPLLVKLIDAAEWLSLQVHPSDGVAAELYGPAALGKAEAWLVVDAEPGASLVAGPRPGLAEADLRAAIRDGVVGREHCAERPCAPGDMLLLEAGTMHAIGPGTFVYEIEQPSDVTFRMSDWGRPATAERPLHVAESLRAIRPAAHAVPVGRDWRLDGGALEVREFRLEVVTTAAAATRAPAGQSLEVVTAIRGRAELVGDGWREVLEPWETVVVPAAVAAYRVQGPEDGLACIGSVP